MRELATSQGKGFSVIGYDVIGDIHGHADALKALLKKLGYRIQNGVWCHPERMAIFVCDLVDRGRKQLETIRIVRDMKEAGAALAVMGNHELNAVAWHTPHPEIPGDHLRTHLGKKGARNRHQHTAFLAEVEHIPELHADIIDWFKTLPLWLDLPELRVVHACWHQSAIDFLTPLLTSEHQLPDALWPAATLESTKADPEAMSVFVAVEALLKGIELPLPEGGSFVDADGNNRKKFRASWWEMEAHTFHDHARLCRDSEYIHSAPTTPIPDHLKIQPPKDKPIFFGHYWHTGRPVVFNGHMACVDYSAGHGHPLVAYRWSGESQLTADNFVLSH